MNRDSPHPRRRRRIVLFSILGAVLLGTLWFTFTVIVPYATFHITRDDLVGTWTTEDKVNTITFKPDGTFESHGTGDLVDVKLENTGTWDTSTVSNRYIVMTWAQPPLTAYYHAEYDNGQPVLVMSWGDTDNPENSTLYRLFKTSPRDG